MLKKIMNAYIVDIVNRPNFNILSYEKNALVWLLNRFSPMNTARRELTVTGTEEAQKRLHVFFYSINDNFQSFD